MSCAFHIPALALRVRALKDLIQTSHPPHTRVYIRFCPGTECAHIMRRLYSETVRLGLRDPNLGMK